MGLYLTTCCQIKQPICNYLIEKTERHSAQAPALRERYLKSSIVNTQFPDKTGFTFRYNPASGISATTG